MLVTTSTAVFACYGAACAPPPVGTGGSGGKGRASGGGGRSGGKSARMTEVATHQLKRMGMNDAEVKSLLDGSAPDSLKQVARPWLKKQGFTPAEVRSLIGRDSGGKGAKVQKFMDSMGRDRAHGVAGVFADKASAAAKRGDSALAARHEAARDGATEIAGAKDASDARSRIETESKQLKFGSNSGPESKARVDGMKEAFYKRFGEQP